MTGSPARERAAPQTKTLRFTFPPQPLNPSTPHRFSVTPPHTRFSWRHSRWTAAALLLVLLAAGTLLAGWAVARADRELRAELLQQTQLVAQPIQIKIKPVQAFSGTAADLALSSYQQLKALLAATCAANPKYRFAYLLGRRADGAVFFFVDSEPINSKDYSPPGQVYEEVPAEDRHVFDTKAAIVRGPSRDRWGTWVSALVPLVDPQTGAVVAILGLDIDASTWKGEVAARAALPVGLMLILLIGAATLFAATHRTNAAPKPVMRRLLPPLTVMVLLLLGGTGSLLYQQHQQHLAREIAAQTADADGDLRTALEQQTASLTVTAQVIAADANVQQGLRTGNAAGLLTTWRPVFETLQRQQQVAYFNFITADRVVLLRVHQPEKRGDHIERFTLIETERTGKTVAGLEPGRVGAFTLRVVQPVIVAGQRVGYVELGKEISDVLQVLRERSGLEQAVIIRKDRLNRQAWETSMSQRGRQADWDRLPHSVVIYASQGRLPDAFAAWADPAMGVLAHHETSHEIAYAGKNWRVSAVPLPDASGQMVGDLLVLRDVSPEEAAFARLLTVSGAAGAVLVALLLSFFYVLLRRTDAGILAQQATLRDAVTRFDQLAAQSGTVIWEVNTQGLYTYVNHAVETVFGYRPDELTGRLHFYDLHPEAGREAFKTAAFAAFARQETFQDLVNDVQTKDGRQIWVSTNGLPVLNADGGLRGYRGSDTDVTAREHATAHSDQQLQFARALNAIAEVIINQNQAEVILESANRMIGETLRLDRALIYAVDFDHHYLTGLCEWLRTPHPDVAPTKNRYDLTLFSSPLAVIRNSGAYLESQATNVNPHFIPDGSGKILHGQLKIKSLLWYPFAFNEHGYHLFTLNQILTPRQWTTEELAFLESAAKQISLALIKLSLLEQRQQQERRVRESEAHFRSYFELPLHGIAITSPEKGWIEVNERICSMLGYTRAEILRMTWSELTHPEDLTADAEQFDRLLSGQIEQYQMEKRFIRKDGTVFWTHLAVGCVREADGRVNHVLALLDDIDARKQAEMERERLSVAIEQAAEVIVITDALGTIEYVNPAFTTVTGYSRAEAIGQNPRLLKSGQQDAAFYHDLWATLAGGKAWQGRFVNRKKNGTLYTEEATISPVLDAAGRITKYVAAKRDITEHLNLHAQLTQAQKMEAVGRLAGGVAHDFNNILQTILGDAELAIEQTAPADAIRRDLEDIRDAAHRAADLTRQLLAFARKQVITPRTLDLNATVEGILKMLRRLIGENIELNWAPGAGLWPVKMDPGQIDQILANLCVNARDAINGVGAVQIATQNTRVDELNAARHEDFSPGDYVLLTVSDTGGGMDAETRDRIFEPFFTTKPTSKGTGLGLATVYGIVRQNRGHIGVYSEPGQGTTFRIHLPRHADAEAAPRTDALANTAPGGDETVLLVEDDLPLLNLSGRILRGLGYTVLAANAPEAALRLAEEHPGEIHLLLTDIIMPGMNGRQLAEQLTARRPRLKCLFMSGFTADVIARQGILDEDVHFIQKPFSAADLAAKIRKTLEAT